jgi:hypothetical protein
MGERRVTAKCLNMFSCIVLCLAFASSGLGFRAYGQQQRVPATPQRPTFAASTSTTVPGTFEIESDATAAERAWTWPTTLKFTPDVQSGLFHRLELSVAAEMISSHLPEPSHRVNQFGNAIDFAARRSIFSYGPISMAIAPRATFFLRDISDGSIL